MNKGGAFSPIEKKRNTKKNTFSLNIENLESKICFSDADRIVKDYL